MTLPFLAIRMNGVRNPRRESSSSGASRLKRASKVDGSWSAVRPPVGPARGAARAAVGRAVLAAVRGGGRHVVVIECHCVASDFREVAVGRDGGPPVGAPFLPG